MRGRGLVLIAVVAAGCGGARVEGPVPVQPGPPASVPPANAPVTPPVDSVARAREDSILRAPRAAHAGFDTRVYPGEAALRTWKQRSPYEWVGYYLPAPCQTGATWVGKRSALREMGWGIAVIFIGEQDWRTAKPDTSPAATPVNAQCSSANLTAAKAALDAARADSTMAGEGFAAGTAVFLDVERVENVSAELDAYVRGWLAAMLRSGRYTPGIYVHERNANALYAIAQDEFRKAGRTVPPPMWVASRTSFDIAQPLSASGFPFATIWQGKFNVRETWGGVTLLIDANVASQDQSQ
jgi:hypothetical protein